MTDRKQTEPRRDAGAYIGRKPERATETIPGGVGRGDRRVSAVATQRGPAQGPIPEAAHGAESDPTPSERP